MAIYERETRVEAPLEAVWSLYSHPSGLEALTPPWLDLRVESAVGPNGEPDPDTLETGSLVSASIRPFSVGPRRRWTTQIVARERSAGAAYFRDELLEGPVERWEHTHAFFADGEATRLCDRVEYAVASCPLGDVVDPLASPGFEAVFRERHGRTKALLER